MTYAMSIALSYFKRAQNATSEDKRIECEDKGKMELVKLRERFSKDIFIFEQILSERQKIKGVTIR